jgi:hypothetical protein
MPLQPAKYNVFERQIVRHRVSVVRLDITITNQFICLFILPRNKRIAEARDDDTISNQCTAWDQSKVPIFRYCKSSSSNIVSCFLSVQ